MYRTHKCGELRETHIGETIKLSGWVQKVRDLGAMTFIDLRDRYGLCQLVVEGETQSKVSALNLGREYVISVEGNVRERESKNPQLPTGDVEVVVDVVELLNASEVPPFTIEDKTDGGEELRMKYRYLDLRREPLKQNLLLRSKVDTLVREYLNAQEFLNIETPYLIKSTPEGARDFLVPSRLNKGSFYALPQSPQTFKQLLMVSGYDKYYQIVRCFRDEDLRSDRQPEFTQVDCEMTFVTQQEVMDRFEGLMKYLLKEIHQIEYSSNFPVITYQESMASYGNDKPDIRFDMKIKELTSLVQGKGFKVFDAQEYVGGICVKNVAKEYSRKKIDTLIEWVKRPQLGGAGLVWVKYEQGTSKSSVDKFYTEQDKQAWKELFGAEDNDMVLIATGSKAKTQAILGELRLELADTLGLRKENEFAPLWIVDFPLVEWDEEAQRYHAVHHPFTAPKQEDVALMDTDPASVRAQAYDLVLNGNEVGGGSIRIHDSKLQSKAFSLLDFSEQEAQEQFGFLLNAFKYGAPPHGGLALGFDRLVALLGGQETIRDFIAFPKNNSGRDIMIDSPSVIQEEVLAELEINVPKVDISDGL